MTQHDRVECSQIVLQRGLHYMGQEVPLVL